MLSHAEFILVFGSQGAGTDDEVLIEILASRTGEQIKEITKVYKKGELLTCESWSQMQIIVFTVCKSQGAQAGTAGVGDTLI